MTSTEANLVGTWQFEKCEALETAYKEVELTFKEGGQLTYSIPSKAGWQLIRLTWCVEKASLITNQPSHPRIEHTQFEIEGNGLLRLEFGGTKTWFRRKTD